MVEMVKMVVDSVSVPVTVKTRIGLGPESHMPIVDLARRLEDAGVAAIIFTDIARDGLLKGLNLDATIALAEQISIPVIASGGFASIEDVKALLQPRAKKLAGAIAGRARYDGDNQLVDLTPSNCVMGRADINGRPVVIVGDDFTVRGGSADATIKEKPLMAEQMAEVQRVLAQIGAGDVPQLVVFNKLDRLDETERPRSLSDAVELPDGPSVPRVFVSARTGEGLDGLRQAIAAAVEAPAHGSLNASASSSSPAIADDGMTEAGDDEGNERTGTYHSLA